MWLWIHTRLLGEWREISWRYQDFPCQKCDSYGCWPFHLNGNVLHRFLESAMTTMLLLNSSQKCQCKCKSLLPVDGHQLLIVTNIVRVKMHHFCQYVPHCSVGKCRDTARPLPQPTTLSTECHKILLMFIKLSSNFDFYFFVSCKDLFIEINHY